MVRSDRDLSSKKGPSSRRAFGFIFAGAVLCITLLTVGEALIAIPMSAAIGVIGCIIVAIALVWVVHRVGRGEHTAPQPSPGVVASFGPSIAGLVFVIAASFSGALVSSQLHNAGTESRAKAILSNAIPSITHLSAARTALRQLGTLVDDLLLTPSHVTTVRGDVAAARASLDASLAAYEALPPIPHDLEYVAHIARSVALANESIDRVLAGTGASPATQSALHEELHARLARTDEAVERLTLENSAFAEQSAAAVIEHRRSSAVAAALFGAISIIVAGIAGWLAIGRLRAHAMLVEERDRFLCARATELEVFSGRVAHDLRNPLASVALRAAALQERHRHDPELRDDLGKMIRQTQRMAEIIDDLLAFASAGAIPQPDASADLHEIVDEVVADLRPEAERMHAELRVDEFPAMCAACTPAALTCVLSNLVGNAVKYLGEGRHAAGWVALRVRARGGVARVEVEDTGPGLPPGSEQRVFEPFQRLSRSKPGIGLGLATVKKIVEAYGGQVGVRSSAGAGSTFWFELPLALTSSEARGRTATT